MGKFGELCSVSPLYEVKQVVLIVLTLTTIILAAVAYAELKEISNDVIDVINNWKLIPYTEVYIANEGEDCDSNYEEVSYKYGRFEGLAPGHCGCVSNSMGIYSSFANCTAEQDASGYCMTSNPREGVSASTWRYQKVCFKRSGEPSASWTNGFVRRPYVDEDGLCPSGYKKCGAGVDYENDNAICYPEGELCPITAITIEPSGTTPTGNDWVMSNGTFSRDDHVLWYRREGIGELPLAQLALTLTEYSSSDVGPDYDHTKNNRGPCYTGGAQDIKNAVDVSDFVLAEHSLSKPSKCKRVDRRYRLFDKLRLDSFYLDQIEELSHCSGYDILTLDDPSYNSATDADYYRSGNVCVGSDCDRDTTFPTNCRSGSSDDAKICDLVVNQNICGQYVAAIRDLEGDSNSYGTYYRSEIQWNPDCAVDRDSLRDNVDPLKRALDAQLGVVVISTIFGVLVGIIWPIYMLTYGKPKFYGKPNEITVPERVDSLIHIFKISALIASVVILGDIYELYEKAGQDNCSDGLTNESFDYLAQRLPEIYFTNMANIGVEAAMTLAGIYFLFSKMKSQMKVDVEPTVENHPPPRSEDNRIPTIATVPIQHVQAQNNPHQPLQGQPMSIPMQPMMVQPQPHSMVAQNQPFYVAQPGMQAQQQPMYVQMQQPMYAPMQQVPGNIQAQGMPVQAQQQPMYAQMQQPMYAQMQQQPVNMQGQSHAPQVQPVNVIPTVRN